MYTPTSRPSGACSQRFARWLGLDHNPLRRTSDRLEVWLRLVALVLLLTAVQAGAFMCGQTANHMLAQQTRAQQRSSHLVSATLTQAAPAGGYGTDVVGADVWAQARWTAPDGALRSGQVLAPGGEPAGHKVAIWVNNSGTTVRQQAQHQDVVASAIALGGIGGLFLILLLISVHALIRRAVDRWRLQAWDREWQATEPLWSGHRS